MSKAFWGGLRVGWIRASPGLVAELAAARHSIDLAGPVLEQLVAADLLAHAEEHLPARRRELAVRRDVLSAALRASQPRWHWRRPSRGSVPMGDARRSHLHRHDDHGQTTMACD